METITLIANGLVFAFVLAWIVRLAVRRYPTFNRYLENRRLYRAVHEAVRNIDHDAFRWTKRLDKEINLNG